MKFWDFVRLGKEPDRSSPTYMLELAVKAAQEDVCSIVHDAAAVILFAEGHWKIGILVALLAIAQTIEALKWSILLRAERGFRLTREGGAS